MRMDEDPDVPVPAPAGLECTLLEVGGAVVAVLSYRLDEDGPSRALTRAETVVMKAVFDGKTNEQIARERGTSPRTVANQIASIFRKHHVSSRSELVARYLSLGSTP